MDTKRLELLLRNTIFSQALLTEIWDSWTSEERLELLLLFRLRGLPERLAEKALNDPNPVVRMLAVKCSVISEERKPELHARLLNDPSPLVRAAIKSDKFSVDTKYLASLSQVERLGVIALADYFNEEAFAEYISHGLSSGTLSEDEAAVLVLEFVRNPNLTALVENEPLDGLDWYSTCKSFDAIWNLTTCTSAKVHRDIAWYYPLKTGDHTISNEIMERMSGEALKALAFRQHGPLLNMLKDSPEKFDKEIHQSEEFGLQSISSRSKNDYGQSEAALARNELEEFREEVRESLGNLAQRLDSLKWLSAERLFATVLCAFAGYYIARLLGIF
jgi:hypothetical protein